jgi:C4-dicarboxylate-specific signal transduction histidine kinase
MGHQLAWQAGILDSLEIPSGALTESQPRRTDGPRVANIRELSASIAHEVNQPLAAIVANAETCLSWLGKNPPDIARARKAAERIVRDGYRASAVLNSMRVLLKPRAPAMSHLDLNALIRDIAELMRNELIRYDVVLQIDLCKTLRYVRGNRTQLQQVLVNLIKNAIESMTDSAARPLLVRVSTAAEGQLAVVAVEDFGGGFDTIGKECMFEPFFTTKPQGTGIGLPICRSIVEGHGGVLWACSKKAQGSVFRFTVPVINPSISIED